MNVFEIFFSPTGTSHRVAESVARAMAGVTPAGTAADAGCLTTLDATHKPVATTVLAADDAAVVAVPVYGGRVAPLALERLAGLDFGGAAVVGVVTYGNRDFERAAVELAGFVHTHGGRLVAVAAFVGEHSYSTEATPIAPGRPDMDDLAVANALGRAVRRKLALPAWKEADARKLKAPASGWLSVARFVRFVASYRRHPERFSAMRAPKADAALCTHCGRCAAACPTGAIVPGNETETDADRCIRCCACVKGCPRGARTFTTPFAPALARNFKRRKAPVYIY